MHVGHPTVGMPTTASLLKGSTRVQLSGYYSITKSGPTWPGFTAGDVAAWRTVSTIPPRGVVALAYLSELDGPN